MSSHNYSFDVEEINFHVHGDERGKLIALESCSDKVPFEIKRVYYIYDTQVQMARGNHAHKSLKQVLVCISGACTISCETPDGVVTEYRLSSPEIGLKIEGFVWRQMRDFSHDAVLMVLANEHFNEEDYVRNYEVFKKECGR